MKGRIKPVDAIFRHHARAVHVAVCDPVTVLAVHRPQCRDALTVGSHAAGTAVAGLVPSVLDELFDG